MRDDEPTVTIPRRDAILVLVGWLSFALMLITTAPSVIRAAATAIAWVSVIWLCFRSAASILRRPVRERSPW